MVEFVKKLNKSKLISKACCSGMYSDHYDIEMLEENYVPSDAIKQDVVGRPRLVMKSIYHSVTESEDIIVSDNFYAFQKSVRNTHDIAAGSKPFIPDWRLWYSSGSYIFEIPRSQGILWLNKCDTFSDYDSIVKKSIRQLWSDMKPFIKSLEEYQEV